MAKGCAVCIRRSSVSRAPLVERQDEDIGGAVLPLANLPTIQIVSLAHGLSSGSEPISDDTFGLATQPCRLLGRGERGIFVSHFHSVAIKDLAITIDDGPEVQ